MFSRFFRRDKSWVKRRAEKDFRKLWSYSGEDPNNLNVISIDMQRNFLNNVVPVSKRDILIEYHKHMQYLCLENQVKFVVVTYGSGSGSVLKTSKSSTNEKYENGVGKEFVYSMYLNGADNLYVIGLNRDDCIISSIKNLAYVNKFKIYTSILGTKNSIKKIKKIKTIREADIDEFSLKNELKLLNHLDVEILDYYSNESKNSEDLEVEK